MNALEHPPVTRSPYTVCAHPLYSCGNRRIRWAMGYWQYEFRGDEVDHAVFVVLCGPTTLDIAEDALKELQNA